MNERIKQLAEQVSLELFNDTAQHRLLKGFAEKFAEALVREAAWFMEQNTEVDIDGNAWRAPDAQDMLTHFGIDS